jgi:hypothetical protein
MSLLEDTLEICIRHALLIQSDIIPDCRVKESIFLKDDTDIRPQALLSHRGNIMSIDHDLPESRIVKPEKEARESRLARSSMTDESNLLSWLHREVYMLQDRTFLIIGK